MRRGTTPTITATVNADLTGMAVHLAFKVGGNVIVKQGVLVHVHQIHELGDDMTIASAFNEIAVAQGGTPSTSGTIAGAIDALNDALAGSDQQSAQTIEDAVRLLGQNIGGGGGSVEHSITCYAFDSQTHERVSVDGRICSAEIDDGVYDITETEIQTAYAGTVLCAGMFTQDNVSYTPLGYGTESASIGELTGSEAYFVMPNENCEVFYTSI